MTKQTLYIISSVLIIAGLALIVLGLQRQPALWYAGLGAVATAMLLSLATHWAPEPQEEPERKDA